MNTIQRYPRPQGLTNLSIRYNEDKTKKNKANLNKAIISFYLNNQLLYVYPLTFAKLNPWQQSKDSTQPTKNNKIKNKRQQISTLNNNSTTKDIKRNPTHNNHQYQIRIIEYRELCLMFGFSHSKVQKLLAKYLSRQGKTYLDNQGINDTISTTRAILLGQFFRALNTAQGQEGWQEELKAVSRDWGYKPSMVKEANSAISTTQSMTQSLFNMGTQLLKVLAPNSMDSRAQNIQNNYYGQVPDGSEPLDEAGHLLSTTKALELMEAKGLLSLPSELEHEALKAKYLTPDVPSTQALPSDAQGIMKKEVITLKDTGELAHEDRREEGLLALNPLDNEDIEETEIID